MKLKSIKTALAVSVAIASSALAQSTIHIKGSDTLGNKLVPQLKAEYVKAHPGINIEVTPQGSSHAFTNLFSGSADIGMSSRLVKQDEIDKFDAAGKTLVEHVAAWDMIAIIVNEENPVKKLTLEQVKGIFTGRIKNWSEVGGADAPISSYTRNASSGTYKSFSKLGMAGEDYGSDCQRLEGNQPICTEVSKNKNGIGYVGLAYAEGDNYKTVKVDNVSPKIRKLAKYPLARKLFYYTVGEPDKEVKKFLEFSTTTAKANEVVEAVGFIPLSVAKAAMSESE